MIALEVLRNGRTQVRAGRAGMERLFATLSWISAKAGTPSKTPRRPRKATLSLRVVGRTGNSYREWKRIRVQMGDDIVLRVVTVDAVDAPYLEEKDDPAFIARAQRQIYLKLKRKFEPASRLKRRSRAIAGPNKRMQPTGFARG